MKRPRRHQVRCSGRLAPPVQRFIAGSTVPGQPPSPSGDGEEATLGSSCPRNTKQDGLPRAACEQLHRRRAVDAASPIQLSSTLTVARGPIRPVAWMTRLPSRTRASSVVKWLRWSRTRHAVRLRRSVRRPPRRRACRTRNESGSPLNRFFAFNVVVVSGAPGTSPTRRAQRELPSMAPWPATGRSAAAHRSEEAAPSRDSSEQGLNQAAELVFQMKPRTRPGQLQAAADVEHRGAAARGRTRRNAVASGP